MVEFDYRARSGHVPVKLTWDNVLKLLHEHHDGLTAAEIAEKTGSPKQNTHNLLAVMRAADEVEAVRIYKGGTGQEPLTHRIPRR